MSSSNIRIYQVVCLANPLQKMEIRGLATKEDEIVVSHVTKTKEWENGNFGETDPRTQFPPLAERPYSEAQLKAHFQTLLLNGVHIFDAVKGVYLNQAVPA